MINRVLRVKYLKDATLFLGKFQIFAISFVFAIAFLALDLYLPLGIASGVAYIAVIVPGLWFPNRAQVFAITTFTILLTIVGFFQSPEGDVWNAILNRGLTITVILVTCFVVLFARRSTALNGLHRGSEIIADSRMQSAPLDNGEPEHKSYDLISTASFRGLAAGFVILLIMVGMTFWISSKSADSLSWVSHTHRVHDGLSSIISSLKDAETGQRGFLLTNNEKYLEPFNQATGKLGSAIDNVQTLISDNPDQQRRLEQILPLIAEKMEELNRTVELSRSQRSKEALEVVESDQGKIAMDKLRVLIGEMIAEEEKLLRNREIAFERNESIAFVVDIIGLILLILIGANVIFRVRDLLSERYEVEAQIRTAKILAEQTNFELQELTDELLEAVEEQHKLSRAIEQSHTMLFITDARGIIEYANPRFLNFMGFELDEIIGRNVKFFKSEDVSPEIYETLWESLKSDKIWSSEMENRRRDGEVFWSQMTISPIKASDGNTGHFLATMTDLTERREIEQKMLQTQKMESLGSLSGGIAHDINNMLVPIINIVAMTIQSLPESRKERVDLQSVLKAADRIKSLVERILAFSRQDKNLFEKVSVTEVVKESIELIETIAPATIKVTVDLDEVECQVVADRSQISTILLNLASNSLDAMEGQVGELTISSKIITVSEEEADTNLNLGGRSWARVSVSDTGKGMSPEVLHRVFDPFFTTKEVGKGTGLELSMVYGLIANHDGVLDVSSSIGKGTTIELFFPLYFENGSEVFLNNSAAKPHAFDAASSKRFNS